jgi:ribosomal protein S18 acetylase RimI-like enzyme
MQSLAYSIATASDADDIIRLIARVFSESEPPAVAMGLSCDDMKQFLQLIVPSVLPDGITVIARSGDTGNFAGVMLCDDFASPPSVDPSHISSKFLPILSMLEELDEQFRRGKAILPGQILHLFMLAVDSRFAGQGVGQGMVRTCVDNGARKGYRIGVTEATGRVSQHIFRKNGFVDRFSVAYRDFRFNDKAVFSEIEVHEKAILMERSLERTR